jgi:hypothetical protein
MRLYHFLSQEYALEALRNKRIKVSIIDKLNDPFEFQVGFSNPNQDTEGLFSVFKTNISKKYGILCFSRNWSNPLLWSHYAKKHTGFALGFELPDNAAIKVEYTEDRPLFPFDKLPQDDKEIESFLNKLIRTKFSSWNYEEEVRFHYFLSELNLQNGLYFNNFDNSLILKEVIAGCNCVFNEELPSLLGGFKDITVIKSRMDLKKFQIVQEFKKI